MAASERGALTVSVLLDSADGKERAPRRMSFAPATRVRAVVAAALEAEGLSAVPKDGKRYGLAFADASDAAAPRKRPPVRWLLDAEGSTLASCGVADGAALALRVQSIAHRVQDLEGELRKVVLLPVAAAVQEVALIVAARFAVAFPKEYALQRVVGGQTAVWLRPEESLAAQAAPEDALLFRKRFFVNDHYLRPGRDPSSVHFAFVEARRAVVSGAAHVLTQAEAVLLAALQMQVTFRNYNPMVHVPGFLDLKEFLPPEFRGVRYIEEDIYNEHRKLADVGELEAKFKYLQKCLALPTYGLETFRAHDRGDDRSSVFHREIILGVKFAVLLCLDTQSKAVLARHSLFQMTNLRARGSALVFLPAGAKQEEEFHLPSQEDATTLASLIESYLRIEHAGPEEEDEDSVNESSVHAPDAADVRRGSVMPPQ